MSQYLGTVATKDYADKSTQEPPDEYMEDPNFSASDDWAYTTSMDRAITKPHRRPDAAKRRRG